MWASSRSNSWMKSISSLVSMTPSPCTLVSLRTKRPATRSPSRLLLQAGRSTFHSILLRRWKGSAEDRPVRAVCRPTPGGGLHRAGPSVNRSLPENGLPEARRRRPRSWGGLSSTRNISSKRASGRRPPTRTGWQTAPPTRLSLSVWTSPPEPPVPKPLIIEGNGQRPFPSIEGWCAYIFPFFHVSLSTGNGKTGGRQ
jgi:hypothetical protein